MTVLTGVDVDDFKKIGLKTGCQKFEEIPNDVSDLTVLVFSAARFATMAFLSSPNKQGRFEILQLRTSFQDVRNKAKVNDWNTRMRFVKAIVEDGDIYFDMDILAREITEDTLEAYFSIWISSLFEIGSYDW